MCCVVPAYLAITVLGTLVVSVYLRLTFLAEHTWFANTIRPIGRRTCRVPEYRDSSGNVVANPPTGGLAPPIKIGVIMLYETADITKAWMQDMLHPLVNVRSLYCRRHNYTLLNGNKLIDKSRPTAWSKLLILEHYFRSGAYDYLFYLDMDTVIMNPSVTLESFIDASARKFDIVITEDTNGLNTGVMLMRNSPWTLWFLRTAWEQSQLVDSSNTTSPHYLFRWEQRAFHYLTNSVQWQAAKLPKYPGDYTEIRKHFYLLPQCAFNSYILHPFDITAVREDSQYAPGDFLIHFAGKNQASRRALMRYYLDQALEEQRRERDAQLSLRGAITVNSTLITQQLPVY
jgi:hypothetical protein